MKKRQALFVLIVTVIMMLAAGAASADNDKTVSGDGWSLSEDLTLTIENDEGWKDYAYENSHVEEIGTLCLGKDVSDFALSNDIVESGANGRIDPARTDAGYWPELSPTHIIVEAGNKVFQATDGLLINQATNTIVLAERDIKNVKVPNGIVTIGVNAFKGRSIESVYFPDSLRSIQAEAFSFCFNLKDVFFGTGLTDIGKYAFSCCDKMRAINLPPTITQIGEGAFAAEEPETKESGMNTILTLPEQVKELGANAFLNRIFQTVEFPDGLQIRGNKPDKAYKRETFCFYYVQTAVFRGDVYDFQYGSIYYADRLIFLSERPEGILRESIASKTLTVYYLDEFADAWSPNSETEWNGWPIQQITRAEAEAMIAGAELPTLAPTTEPTKAPQPMPTAKPTSTPESEQEQGTGIDGTLLVLGGCIVAVAAAIIVLAVRRRNTRRASMNRRKSGSSRAGYPPFNKIS